MTVGKCLLCCFKRTNVPLAKTPNKEQAVMDQKFQNHQYQQQISSHFSIPLEFSLKFDGKQKPSLVSIEKLTRAIRDRDSTEQFEIEIQQC